jgi:Flp pilus assembly protein TadD
VNPPPLERPRRKLSIFWAIRFIGAIASVFRSARDRRPISAPQRSILLDKGKKLVEQGKLTEAIKELRRVIKIKPREAEAHYLLAVPLEGKEQFEAAIAEYRDAIALSPFAADAHHNLGVILADQGKLEEAIEHYRKAIRLKTDAGEFHNNLGSALEAQGNQAEAIAEYRNAIWYLPENPTAHLNLGNALDAQGKHVAALAELRKTRQRATPGSEIARLIERALTAAEHRGPGSAEAAPNPSADSN